MSRLSNFARRQPRVGIYERLEQVEAQNAELVSALKTIAYAAAWSKLSQEEHGGQYEALRHLALNALAAGHTK